MNTKSSLAITVYPGRENYASNALIGAASKLNPFPDELILLFNKFDSSNAKKLLEISFEYRCSVLLFTDHKPLSFLWNTAIKTAMYNKVLICNDDIEFINPNALIDIDNAHNSGFGIVKAAENYSGFSITKKTYDELGPFDENYSWSWEDFDYSLRAEQKNIKTYSFKPEIIRHIRATGSRREDLWIKSGIYFFKKWKIKEKFPNLVEHEADPEEIKKLIFSGFFHGGIMTDNGLVNFFEEMKKHV